MLAMVVGGAPFAANPLDGLTFFFEPVQPLAATIVQEFGGGRRARSRTRSTRSPRVLLLSSAFLSFAGWASKQPLKRYGIGV